MNKPKTLQLSITPVAKPRMTQRDVWKKRPIVLKYRAYKDELRIKARDLDLEIFTRQHAIDFFLPMPKAWSKKRRLRMNNQPHDKRPDIDNLHKGFMDALLEEDSGVHSVCLRKLWSEIGGIIIYYDS